MCTEERVFCLRILIEINYVYAIFRWIHKTWAHNAHSWNELFFAAKHIVLFTASYSIKHIFYIFIIYKRCWNDEVRPFVFAYYPSYGYYIRVLLNMLYFCLYSVQQASIFYDWSQIIEQQVISLFGFAKPPFLSPSKTIHPWPNHRTLSTTRIPCNKLIFRSRSRMGRKEGGEWGDGARQRQPDWEHYSVTQRKNKPSASELGHLSEYYLDRTQSRWRERLRYRFRDNNQHLWHHNTISPDGGVNAHRFRIAAPANGPNEHTHIQDKQRTVPQPDSWSRPHRRNWWVSLACAQQPASNRSK